MNKEKHKDVSKDRNKSQSEEKAKTQLTGDNEDFNTGNHTPSSLRNVGAGYDDTGMGNNAKASDNNDKMLREKKTKKIQTK